MSMTHLSGTVLTRRSFLAIAGLGALGLTGCSGTQGSDSGSGSDSDTPKAANGKLDPSNPTEITFYSYSLSMASAKSTMQSIIDGFNESVGAEKGVKVTGVAEDISSGSLAKSTADIQAGNKVNIIQDGFPTLDAGRLNLGLQAYEDLFGKDAMNEAFEGIDKASQQLGVIDGKMYGIAFTFSTPVLYVNGSVFKAAGLDPEKDIPSTWEQMGEVCKKIKDATGKYGLCMGASAGDNFIPESILFSNGAKILSDDRTKAVFASDESVEALQMWRDLYKQGLCAPVTDTEASQLFAAGNAGMQLFTTAVYSLYQQSAKAAGWELTGAGEPSFGSKAPVPVNSGSCLAVRAADDNEAAACWEFIKYATSAESYTKITEGIGYLPLRTQIADDSKYLKDFVDKNPLIRKNLEQLKNIKPSTIWPGDTSTETNKIFMDAINKCISTDDDIMKILTGAQDQINSMIG